MLDSTDVLLTAKLAYTIYAIAILVLFAWFASRLTGGKADKVVKPTVFYGFIALLVFCGVFIHILTFNKIPWVKQDLHRGDHEIAQTFHITVEDHQFILPAEKIVIQCGQTVMFDVESKDLTYGFGLFRNNHSMVFQMQVVPGSKNTIVWEFHKSGIYDIRSTEYSGPEGANMVVEKAVQVVGCSDTDKYSN